MTATIVLAVIYLVGWLAAFYLVIPALVQGPTGVWLYRACLLQPRSWALGLPFVAAALVLATLWPLALLVWLVAVRRPPPLITTQALADFYDQRYQGEGPVLTRVPGQIPMRITAPSAIPTSFGSAAEFWDLYLSEL